MPAFTSRLNLYKPGGGSSGVIPDEVVDVDKINDNSDKIDAAIGAPNFTSGTRPAAPFSGQIIYETDTQLLKQWSGTAWLSIGGKSELDKIAAMYDGGAITTQDLNTLLKSGSWRQLTAADATVARNYPFAGAIGVLTVEAANDCWRQTLHHRVDNFTTAIFERVYTGAWSPWRTVWPFAAILPSSVSAGTVNHRGELSVSAVTGVFINGVFDASFKQYEILYDLTTTAVGLDMQVSVAGVAEAGARYDNQRTTAVGATVATVQTTDVSSFQVAPISGALRHTGRMVVNHLVSGDYPTYHATTHSMPAAPTASDGHSITSGQCVLATTSFDGIHIFTVSGTLTGRITVKGIA